MRWIEDQWFCPSCGSEWHGHSGYGDHGPWERITERVTGGKTVYWRRRMADDYWLTVARQPEGWEWKLRRYKPSEVLEDGTTRTVQQAKAEVLDAWYLSEVVAQIDSSEVRP
jgi:hypothetical protein